MSGWLSSSLSTSLQSTLGQIRTITKEIVDDMRIPLEDDDELEQLKAKVKFLEEECTELKRQVDANLFIETSATLRHLVDEIELRIDGAVPANDTERTAILAGSVYAALEGMNVRLSNLVGIDTNLIRRISTLCSENEVNDASWLEARVKFERFPLFFGLFQLLERSVRERNVANMELTKAHDRIQFLSREVNRLKTHLLDIHDQQDHEIRRKLAYCGQLETEMRSLAQQELEARKQIERLTHEKDTLLDELRHCTQLSCQKERELTDKVNQQAQLCSDLRSALTNSHNEAKQTIASLRSSHAAEIDALQKQLSNALADKQSELVIDSSVDQAKHDSELRRIIKGLKMDLALKEEERQALAQTLRNISPCIGNRIEKSIARELVMSFLRAEPMNRIDAIRPLAQVLEFTDEQVEELIELQKQSQGWFPRWSVRRPVKKAEETISLAELLIKYVDQETRPQLRVRFSTDDHRDDDSQSEHPEFN